MKWFHLFEKRHKNGARLTKTGVFSKAFYNIFSLETRMR